GDKGGPLPRSDLHARQSAQDARSLDPDLRAAILSGGKAVPRNLERHSCDAAAHGARAVLAPGPGDQRPERYSELGGHQERIRGSGHHGREHLSWYGLRNLWTVEWIASHACLPRWTAARTASADLAQTKGWRLSLASAMKRLMAVSNSAIEVKTPRV